MPLMASTVFRTDSGMTLEMLDEGRVDSRLKYEFLSASIGADDEFEDDAPLGPDLVLGREEF